MTTSKRLCILWALINVVYYSTAVSMVTINGQTCLDGHYLGYGTFWVAEEGRNGVKKYKVTKMNEKGEKEVFNIEISENHGIDAKCKELGVTPPIIMPEMTRLFTPGTPGFMMPSMLGMPDFVMRQIPVMPDIVMPEMPVMPVMPDLPDIPNAQLPDTPNYVYQQAPGSFYSFWSTIYR